jgi:hypothetical protein
MIGFRVEYETAGATPPDTASFEQFAGVNVNNPGTTANEDRFGKPRMIVSAYSVDPQIVSAGRQFDLALSFQNASSERTVSNIKVTLEAIEQTQGQGAVFTPVGGSNTIFIDEINPKGTVDTVLRMYAVPDAEARTYNLRVRFVYEDEDFNTYEEIEQISISVRQVVRLETSDIYVPPMAFPYQPVFLSFNISNTGRVSIANIRVRVEGNFEARDFNTLAGNLGRGNQMFFQGNFMPMEPGDQYGAIIITGEDNTGELIELVRHDFTLHVMEMGGWDDGGDWREGGGWDDGRFEGRWPMEPEEQTLWEKIMDFVTKPIVWGSAAGVAALVIIVIIVLVKRSRGKREFDFDE